jgi:hypothetical protein
MSAQERYLDMPCDISWRYDSPVRHHWRLIAAVVLAVLFFVGVRAAGGIG